MWFFGKRKIRCYYFRDATVDGDCVHIEFDTAIMILEIDAAFEAFNAVIEAVGE